MDNRTVDLLTRSVFGKTSIQEEKQVETIIQSPLEKILYDRLSKKRDKFKSYEEYTSSLEKQQKEGWEALKKQLTFLKTDKVKTFLTLSFDLTIIIDALETLENYFEKLIPNNYAYTFTPNFNSNDGNEDVLFRVREAVINESELIDFITLLDNQSDKSLIMIFADKKIIIDTSNKVQIKTILNNLKRKQTLFKIIFADAT